MFANVYGGPPNYKDLPNIQVRIDYKNMRNKDFETFSELAIAEMLMAKVTSHEVVVEKGLENIARGLGAIASNLPSKPRE
jgi:hypothetical protein